MINGWIEAGHRWQCCRRWRWEQARAAGAVFIVRRRKYDRDGAGAWTCPVCRWTLRRQPTWPTPPEIGLFRSPAEARWPQASAGSKRWPGRPLLALTSRPASRLVGATWASVSKSTSGRDCGAGERPAGGTSRRATRRWAPVAQRNWPWPRRQRWMSEAETLGASPDCWWPPRRRWEAPVCRAPRQQLQQQSVRGGVAAGRPA